ncbi:MAG: cytochrome c [Trueperaceae bacterium]|nr:cytochrome c [Trueperaceae bacterium]
MKKEKSAPKRFIDRYFWHALIAIIVIGVLANLFIWFSSSKTSAKHLNLPSYPVELVAQGRDIYRANCLMCHGESGQGFAQETIPAPALDSTMHAWHHPDSQIASFLRDGIGQMPAVGENWSDQEITAVLAYIKQWWEPEQLSYQTQSSKQNP